MKRTAMLALAVALTAQAGQARKQSVAVYLRNDAHVPDVLTDRAEAMASFLFAAIDVKIDWRVGEPSPSSLPGAIVVRLASDTPATQRPGALAYAMPCEGAHIVVFWDRMAHAPNRTELLPHVMVHEIAHILEGVSRHSERGIMRPYWSEFDLALMKAHLLSFAPDDVELIRRGLDFRSAAFANQGNGGRKPLGCHVDLEPPTRLAQNHKASRAPVELSTAQAELARLNESGK